MQATTSRTMKLETTFFQQLKMLHALDPEQMVVTLQFAGRDDVPLTRDQLLRGASAYARTLEKEGIEPGEVVILILQHGEDLVYSFWGATLHGAIPSIMPFLTEKLSPAAGPVRSRSMISRRVASPSASMPGLDP